MPGATRSVSPQRDAARPASPQKELPKPPNQSPNRMSVNAAEPAPRSVSPNRMSVNKNEPVSPGRSVSPNRLSVGKELPPVPAPRPGSPQKRNSVSPGKGGERAAEGPPPQELKDLLTKLDDKVRSAARYLMDEQSSLWVQNLDNVQTQLGVHKVALLLAHLLSSL